VESALISLAGLLGVKKRKLKASLTSLKPDEFEALIGQSLEAPNIVLWNKIVGFGTPPPVPHVIHWFHATRVRPETDFNDGVQPLRLILPAIKSFLATLATELPSAGSSTSQVSGGFQYTLKTSNSRHDGPFAFLVRDAITRRWSFTHDYLETPEIVDDYFNGGAGVERFRAITKPCIVKFRSTDPREDVSKIALRYCYSGLWGMGMDFENNTHFDGEGRTIPRSDIVGIEYPTIGRLLPYPWYV